MVWDAAAGNIVLFGGMDASGQCLNDTWTWDGTDWTQQFPPVSPSPRRFDAHGMAYDSAASLAVIFGGITTGNIYFGDTWTWNGIDKTWSQQFPATSPSARRTTLAFDRNSNTMVLFGGDNGATYYNDTWTWDGINWTQQSSTYSPPPRTMGAMVWDPYMQGTIYFGGISSPTITLNDTWLWKNGDWIEVAALGNVPAARWSAAADYDAASKAMVLFGGFDFQKPLSGTWLLVPGH